jgi:quercetin dioxygenase-like cupin family protein
MIALSSTAGHAAESVSVKQVAKIEATVSGQPIVLPQAPSEVNVSVYEIPPAAQLPKHRHPFPRYGYVLAGRLRVTNAETGKIADFKAGDFVVESLNQWHTGANPGTENLKLLVIDQTPVGVGNLETEQ